MHSHSQIRNDHFTGMRKSLKETDLKIFQLQNNLISHVGTLALIKNFVVTVILRAPFRNMTFRMPLY